MNEPACPPRSRLARGMSILMCVCATAMVLGVASAYALTVPWLIEVYDDFDLALPVLTLWLLKVPPPAFLAAGGAAAVLLIIQQIFSRDATAAALVNLVAGMIAMGSLGLLLIAFQLPFIELMRSLF